jgi:hypothetical protein
VPLWLLLLLLGDNNGSNNAKPSNQLILFLEKKIMYPLPSVILPLSKRFPLVASSDWVDGPFFLAPPPLRRALLLPPPPLPAVQPRPRRHPCCPAAHHLSPNLLYTPELLAGTNPLPPRTELKCFQFSPLATFPSAMTFHRLTYSYKVQDEMHGPFPLSKITNTVMVIMQMCKFFLQQRCRFGSNCRTSHGM